MKPTWKTMETNHEKPSNHLEKLWKPTKNHEKPWNQLEKPWKPTKNHGNQPKTMETSHNWPLRWGRGWGRNNTKTWHTRGHNWPFRCLDWSHVPSPKFLECASLMCLSRYSFRVKVLSQSLQIDDLSLFFFLWTRFWCSWSSIWFWNIWTQKLHVFIKT